MTLWGLKCHSLADAACLARPKSTVDEVPWNWEKPPAGLDQTPLVAGAAHQCIFQSSKFSRRHLSKHPHIPSLFSYPRVPDVIPVPLWMPPAWQLPLCSLQKEDPHHYPNLRALEWFLSRFSPRGTDCASPSHFSCSAQRHKHSFYSSGKCL